MVFAGCLFLFAAWLAGYKARNWFNPLSLASSLLAVNCFFTVIDIFAPDERFSSIVGSETATLVCGLGMICASSAAFMRPTDAVKLSLTVCSVRAPAWLAPFALILAVIYLGLLVVKAGGLLPISAMSNLTQHQLAARREDFEIPFVGEFVMGVFRCLLIYLACALIAIRAGARAFGKSDLWLICVSMLICVVFVVAGRRNPAFWAFYIPLLGLTLVTGARIRSVLVWVGGMLVLFVVLGNLRRAGSAYETGLTISSGFLAVDNALSWVAAYFAPTWRNLENITLFIEERYYGAFYLSRILPDSVLSLFGEAPKDASQVMLEMDAFDYGRMTFYSILGDLYYDFGAVGALVVVTVIMSAYVAAYNRSSHSLVALAFVLNFSVSLILMFAVNRFMGLGNILGLLLFIILARSSLGNHLTDCRHRPLEATH